MDVSLQDTLFTRENGTTPLADVSRVTFWDTAGSWKEPGNPLKGRVPVPVRAVAASRTAGAAGATAYTNG